MGSKSSIIESIVKIFPKADHFYDLFGGGFSVTHCMLEKRYNHFKEFHFNEIREGVCDLIKDAIAGKYSYDNFLPEFIDRETFFKRINEPYVKILWSFGNNGKTYLFSKEIEPCKKSMHNAIVFNQFDDLAKEVLQMSFFKDGYTVNQRRLYLRDKIEYYRKTKIPRILYQFLNEKQLQKLERLEQLQQLERLEQLQQLERLQRLQQLQQLERLTLSKLNFYQGDYKSVPIKENSIIYCDIPYLGTEEYDENKYFNHKEFYDWASEQNNPVFISEYKLPDKRFTSILSIKKRSLMASSGTEKGASIIKDEKVFVNKAALKLLINR